MPAVWKISTLEYEPVTGVVKTAHWTVSAESGGVVAFSYGATALSQPDPEGFIDYEDLSEAVVLGWVHGVMGQDERARLEAAAAAALDVKLNPSIISGVPW